MIQNPRSKNSEQAVLSSGTTRHGLILVVGPDGSGKSTLANELVELAEADHLAVCHAHYRPGVLRPAPVGAPAVTEPHNQRARNPAGAFTKLVFVLLDSLFGWATSWRIGAKNGIVIVERGWYDMAVDPRRYRLPTYARKVVRWFGRLLPRADIAVLLAGDAQAIHDRKPEIGVSEVERQVLEWRRLARVAARKVIEVDSVQETPATVAKRVWEELGNGRADPRWQRVPLTSPRLDLHVAGRMPRSAWFHQSYRPSARLVDPLRPALARIGRRDAHVDPMISKIPELCRFLELNPSGLLAMRSSTPGRWIVGAATGDGLLAVLKVGSIDDIRLRREAAVLDAFHEECCRWVPELMWAGEFGNTFAISTRAVGTSRRHNPSVAEVATFCSGLVTGSERRLPLSHGDLAPWNVVHTDKGLCVFDWEHASWERKPLHDLAHYLIQSGALLHRYTPQQVVRLLTAPGSPGWLHLEACDADPRKAGELLRLCLSEAPDFALGSDHFRSQVARCLS